MGFSAVSKVNKMIDLAHKDGVIDARESGAIEAIAGLQMYGTVSNARIREVLVDLYQNGRDLFQNDEVWRRFGNMLGNSGIDVGPRPHLPIGDLPKSKASAAKRLAQVRSAISTLVHRDDRKISDAELKAMVALASVPRKKLAKGVKAELLKQYDVGDSRFESKAVRGALRETLLENGVTANDLGDALTRRDFDRMANDDKMSALFPTFEAGRDEIVFGEWALDKTFTATEVDPVRDLGGWVRARASSELDLLRTEAGDNTSEPDDDGMERPHVQAISKDGELYGYLVLCSYQNWEQTRVFDKNMEPVGKFEIFE